MMHEYFTLPAEKGYQLIKKLQKGEEIDVSQYQIKKGSGPVYPEDELEHLSKRILKEMTTKPEFPTQNDKYLVEATGAKWFHEMVTVDKKAFADPEFWLWLSVKHFGKFITWRYKTKNDEPVKIHNYGLMHEHAAQVQENLLYVMWTKAKLTHNPKLADPYIYTTRTKVTDLLKSFGTRRNYSCIKTFAYSLMSNVMNEKNSNTFNYRDLGKELQGVHASIAFEILTADESDKLIRDRMPKHRGVKK